RERNIESATRIPRDRELSDTLGDPGPVQEIVPPLLQFRAVRCIRPSQEVVAHQRRAGSTSPTHPSGNSAQPIPSESRLDDQLVGEAYPVLFGYRAGEIDESPGDVRASQVSLRHHIGRKWYPSAVHDDTCQHVCTRIT